MKLFHCEEAVLSTYEFAILGSALPPERAALVHTIEESLAEFNLRIDQDVIIHSAESVQERDKSAPFAVVYFGNINHVDADKIQQLAKESVPIIPTLDAANDFKTHIPDFLQVLNTYYRRHDDTSMTELTCAMLESLGLLRRQRHAFISYRRVESQIVASQLHDLLTARGFDVFLDTHDVRPGDPFQDVLWHRLCDSDVMVMLDTPTYSDSKWTRQEIARALVKEIHVLRVVWPGHQPGKLTEIAKTIYLDSGDLGRVNTT